MNKQIEIVLDETKIATLQQIVSNMIRGRKKYSVINWIKYEYEKDLLTLLNQQLTLAIETDKPETIENKPEESERIENLDLTTLIKRKRALQRAIRRSQSGELKKTPKAEKLESWENELKEVILEIKTKLGYARHAITAS